MKDIQVKNINRYLNIDKRQLYKAKNFSQSLAGINMSGLYKEAMKFSSQLGKVGWALTLLGLYSNAADIYEQCTADNEFNEACKRAATKNGVSMFTNVVAGWAIGAGIGLIPVTGGLSIVLVGAGTLAWGLNGGDISNDLGDWAEEMIFE
ncbi:hypothetical protein [uncultured Shewanella sp.]|uniref:hypothetical protein n=1 Tax=uncultured Shewanella sp. TaxID=173975 RepID=UPI002631BFA1|nr:hypothetical protein [uncultured Shewanella sp.]